MRNKPCRKGDRLKESFAMGAVVCDLDKFIVFFLSLGVSHRSDRKGSSINELESLLNWTGYRLQTTITGMVGGSLPAECAAAPVTIAKLDDVPDSGELSATTYEKLRHLAAGYLR